MARATGKVKWFDDIKGFGFITSDAGGKDVFVHHSALPRASSQVRPKLLEGQRVEFDIEADQKGPKAINVSVLA